VSPDPRTAAVVAVGDELLAGDHPDLNTAVIARALQSVGRRLERAVVMGDDELELARTIAELAARHALVFVTGGLGPAHD
jgi:molybdopterin-biosynthesis enzyme MoeA-like protein